jgi:hypothetical protein
MHRPLGIILMRLGIAEIDHEAIAVVLDKVSLKSLAHPGVEEARSA